MRKTMNTINIYNILLYAGISACICGIAAYYIWKKLTVSKLPILKEEKIDVPLQYDDVIGYLKMQHLNKEKHIAFLGHPEDKKLSIYINKTNIPFGYSALIVGILDSTNKTIDTERSKIIFSKGLDKKLEELIADNTLVKLS